MEKILPCGGFFYDEDTLKIVNKEGKQVLSAISTIVDDEIDAGGADAVYEGEEEEEEIKD